ncbi:MAG: 23S rRNA (adenine(2030)-N(6))-methyltransferase RlmJ [Cardiobacteriaceae bacterium]|nr:23S rRNA (adenine(2030)-N(6))-methyltransferase RlmJ [Cardiobacteriaceae bacterium]
MLSYRHHYHAGNFADVFKHFCLFSALEYMTQKDKPLLYLDTHSGAGIYQLDEKNREFASGLGEFFQLDTQVLSEDLRNFRDFLLSLPQRGIIPINALAGSPIIAASLLRDNDTLHLCEMHSTDFPILEKAVKNLRARRTVISPTDGFDAVKAALPPPARRALILIDPSYEIKSDYKRCINALQNTIKRLRSAVVLLWYPLLNRKITEAEGFIPALIAEAEIAALPYFNQTFIQDKNADGMFGCGIFALNPPYQFPEKVSLACQILHKYLA